MKNYSYFFLNLFIMIFIGGILVKISNIGISFLIFVLSLNLLAFPKLKKGYLDLMFISLFFNITILFVYLFEHNVINYFNSLFFKKLGMTLFVFAFILILWLIKVSYDNFKSKNKQIFLLLMNFFVLVIDYKTLTVEIILYISVFFILINITYILKFFYEDVKDKLTAFVFLFFFMLIFSITVFTSDKSSYENKRDNYIYSNLKKEKTPEKEIVKPPLDPIKDITKNEFKEKKQKFLNKKSVLLITIDALTPFHLDLYGYKRETAPNLTSFAKNAFWFKKAFSQGPNTRPAIASLMTSKYVTEIYWTDKKRFIPLKKENLTLAEILKKEGYSTYGVVTHSYFLKRFGYNQGFDNWDMSLISLDPKIAFEQETAKRIFNKFKKIINNSDKKIPKFIWLHFFDPHDSYVFRKEAKNFGKRAMDIYDNEINYTDIYLGKLFDFMRNKNIMNDFVIVITADHGEAFGEHGYIKHGRSVYNDQMWVPLIIKFPNKEPRVIEHEVSHIDIIPTLLDYLKIDGYFDKLSGKSILRKIKENYFPPVFTLLFKKGKHQYAITYKGYKLNYFEKSDLKKLYDLRTDMHELNDISLQNPEIKYDLWNKLSKWIIKQKKLYGILNK